MTDSKQSTPNASGDRPDRDGDAVPEAETTSSRGISIVWLVPIVAAAIGAWLAYTTWQEQGPTIIITFDDAEGLEAGKTKIKYKDVEIGSVEDVQISDDLKQIVTTVQLDKEVEGYHAEGSRFWVVSPRLGAGGVSGLGTLLSGVYIGMDPKPGPPVFEFAGLPEPPQITSVIPGKHFILHAATRGSISRGSPVAFRGLDVGQVTDYVLADDDQSVTITIFVRAPYDTLVHDRSRFWNASGFRASLNANGIRVDTESLTTLLAGGIAFDSPATAEPTEPSAEDTEFALHDNFDSVAEASFTQKIPYLVHFQDSVRGLTPGAPVEYKGIRLGTVKDVGLQIDFDEEKIHIPVIIEIEPQRLGDGNEVNEPYVLMEQLVQRGLRAQLQSGNLLTGALLVDLGFHPNAPKAELLKEGNYPEIPSVPSELEALTASINGVLTEMASLPLKDLVNDLRATVQSVNRLVSSPKAEEALDSLNVSATELQALMRNLDQQIGPLLNQARGTLASAEAMVGPDSAVRYDLNAMFKELTGAARSIRVFADYLERHPEALLTGKPGFANQ